MILCHSKCLWLWLVLIQYLPIKLIKRKNFHLLLSTPRLMWFLIQIQAYICMYMYTYKCICIRVLPEPSAIFTSDFLLFIIHLFNFYTLIACIYIYIYIFHYTHYIYIIYIYNMLYMYRCCPWSLCLLEILSLLRHTLLTTSTPIMIDLCNAVLTDWLPDY